MSANRNKQQKQRDRERTVEMILNPALRQGAKERPNWLGHPAHRNGKDGHARIDAALLDGATMAELRGYREAVERHFYQLEKDHNLPVIEIGDKCMFDRAKLGIDEKISAHVSGRRNSPLKRKKRPQSMPVVLDENHESRFPEGRLLYIEHRTFERDSLIAKKAKKRRLAMVGELRCDVCDFNFAGVYGNCGNGYIEAHHTRPVSELKQASRTKIGDFALVCANCHRILHRSNPMLTVAQLRKIVRSRVSGTDD